MAMLSLQRPLKAVEAFLSSLIACDGNSVTEVMYLQNIGFANLGLWLAHSYLGDHEEAQEEYLTAQEAFIKGNSA